MWGYLSIRKSYGLSIRKIYFPTYLASGWLNLDAIFFIIHGSYLRVWIHEEIADSMKKIWQIANFIFISLFLLQLRFCGQLMIFFLLHVEYNDISLVFWKSMDFWIFWNFIWNGYNFFQENRRRAHSAAFDTPGDKLLNGVYPAGMGFLENWEIALGGEIVRENERSRQIWLGGVTFSILFQFLRGFFHFIRNFILHIVYKEIWVKN